jgi:general secretion pathway protein G
MKLKKNRGFTLIEVIVVAGIIAILAGILVPLIFKEIDEARITRAAADTKSISTAIMVFRKDTGQWPIMDGTCAPNVTFLSGNGTQPGNLEANGFSLSVMSSYNYFLPADAAADEGSCYGTKWKGPYMADVTPDPWGNAYVTNADAFSVKGAPLWILSAGPNGQIDTPVLNTVVIGDDIGIRIQ